MAIPNLFNEDMEKKAILGLFTGLFRGMNEKRERERQKKEGPKGLNPVQEYQMGLYKDAISSEDPKRSQWGMQGLRNMGMEVPDVERRKPGTFFTPEENFAHAKRQRGLKEQETLARIENLKNRGKTKTTDKAEKKIDYTRIGKGLDAAEDALDRLEKKNTVPTGLKAVDKWSKADQAKYNSAMTEIDGYRTMLQSGQGFNMLGPEGGAQGPQYLPQGQPPVEDAGTISDPIEDQRKINGETFVQINGTWYRKTD